jgi:hypothetical protein
VTKEDAIGAVAAAKAPAAVAKPAPVIAAASVPAVACPYGKAETTVFSSFTGLMLTVWR